TQLEVVEPLDATVPMKRPVTVTVRVGGKTPPADGPEALKLLFRYPDEPAHRFTKEIRFEPDTGGLWKATVSADRILSGFFYKVTGGDAETEEYRIQVKSTPLVNDFEVTYHYPQYLQKLSRITHEPNLHAVRGTWVTLDVRTNRKVKEGWLDTLIAGKKAPVPGQVVKKDPEVIQFQL